MSRELKPGWKMVKFGDVVRNANLMERDPQKAGIERIVGLEHIDPENLHIKRWASLEDGTSFSRKFVSGQTLFGKRRAYQKKVAFAEFEGICSGDILTFETKDPKILLPELLPFICQTDSFFEYALGTSAGSLSPRTSWSALKDFTFPLPPLEEQKRMAEVLWTADEAVERYRNCFENHCSFRNIFLEHTHHYGMRYNNIELNELPDGWTLSTVGKACFIQNTLRKPLSSSVRMKMQGEYPYYGPTGVLDFINEYRVDGKYVLIGEDGDHFLKYATWDMTQIINGKCNVNNHAHILSGTDVCLTEWIYYYFKHRDILPYLSRQGAGRLKLNKKTLEQIPIVLPPVDEQSILCSMYASIDKSLLQIQNNIAETTNILKILNNIYIGASHV